MLNKEEAVEKEILIKSIASYNLSISVFIARPGHVSYICSKTRLTENVFTLTPALILTLTLTSTLTLMLKHNTVFELTNDVNFRESIQDPPDIAAR